MANQELLDYVQKAKAAGMSDEQIKSALSANGWSNAEISEAFVPVPGLRKQAVPESARTNQPARRRMGRPFLIAVFLIILVMIAGGASVIVLATRLYDPLWNPFRPSPGKVIEEMLANLQNVKSVRSTITGEILINDAQGKKWGKVTLAANGESDTSDINNLKSNFNVSGNLMLAGSADVLLLADVDVISSNETTFVNFNELVAPDEYNIDSASLLSNWLKLDDDSLVPLADFAGTTVQELNFLQTADWFVPLLTSQNISSVVQEFEDENINGKDLYHYLIKLDKNGLGLGSLSNKIDDINAEAWTGKKDHMLYGWQVEKTIAPNISFKIKSENNNFNNPVLIEEPAGALKIEDFLPSIKNIKVAENLSGIAESAQSILASDKSYYTLCSRGLLNGYQKNHGQSLINFNNEIIKEGAKRPACFASLANYCVSTQLEDGTYMCAGPNTSQGKNACLSSITICQE